MDNMFSEMFLKKEKHYNPYYAASNAGRHCESMVDLCLSKPCHHEGVCSMNMSSVHGYTCSCAPVSLF